MINWIKQLTHSSDFKQKIIKIIRKHQLGENQISSKIWIEHQDLQSERSLIDKVPKINGLFHNILISMLNLKQMRAEKMDIFKNISRCFWFVLVYLFTQHFASYFPATYEVNICFVLTFHSANKEPRRIAGLQTCTHLHDGVHRTRLLAEAAVDALGHVDVVASRPPAAVASSLCFNGDGLETGREPRTPTQILRVFTHRKYWNPNIFTERC